MSARTSNHNQAFLLSVEAFIFIKTNCVKFVVAAVVLVTLTHLTYSQDHSKYGSLDASFGTKGKIIADLGGKDYANALVIQSNGKIVVGGRGGPSEGFAIGRYKKDGQPDLAFGTKGWIVLPFGKGGIRALALQSDQKIIAAGAHEGNLALIRIRPDSSPDQTFHSNGVAITDLGGKDIALALGLQRDGKIVVAGRSDDSIVVVRYQHNGKFDETFGRRGVVQHRYSGPSGPIEGLPRTLMIQPDGKIVLVGYLGTGFLAGDMYFSLWRYNPDGKPDQTFGEGGFFLATASENKAGTCAALSGVLQKDGKIVTAGIVGPAFAVARFLPNGEYDKTFGRWNGLTISSFGHTHEIANAVLIQPDGLIVAGGGGGSSADLALARYRPDGTLDSTFGIDGKVTTDLGGIDIVKAMALQSDGKIVVAGRTNDNFALVRYNP